MGIIRAYRVEHWLWTHHLKPLAMIIKGGIRIIWGGVLPPSVEIGEGTQFTYHALGVVLHYRTVIGKNCVIRQHVTIAGNDSGVPIIGDNCEINTGAVLIGGIHIGNNVRIGANAFVNTDIPDNCTAVGLPAKPVKVNNNSVKI